MATSHPSTGLGPPLPEMLAAVDVGTNSVHMVIARVSGARFEVVTRHKETVRLGSGATDMRVLRTDAIDRGVAALGRCRELAERFEARLRAVATSAVREADNAAVFLRRAAEEAGVEVEVISGVEEARLIHLGALQALALYETPVLLCDIGGGSTELLFGTGPALASSRSFKLGAIRMTEAFFPGGRVTARAVELARRHVQEELAWYRRETQRIRFDTFVASSGTAQTLVEMAIAADGEEQPHSLNGATVTRRRLRRVIESILETGSAEERRALPGIDPQRADILAGGAVVLDEILDLFGVERLTFSEGALREGVLLDTLQRLTGGDLAHLSDLRRSSVLHLVELCDDDPAHADHVARLVGQLFEQLAPELELRPEHGELLEAAALLANVGLFLAHSGHHKHSYYVIRNSEQLTGFTDREIELIAQVARYHRKSAPNEARHPEFAALDPEDRRLVRCLSALLRVAIGLDRSHSALVAGVEARVSPESVVLLVAAAGQDAPSLEIHSAAERSGLLADLLGRPVTVCPAAPAGHT